MVPESVCTTPVVSYHLAIKRGLISTNDFVDSRVEQELCILSTLHGIGVILLSVSNSLESKLLLPTKNRLEIDRQSLNRLVEEYADFKYFISLLKG